MVTLKSLISVDGDCFLGRQKRYLPFNSDVVNYLLKITGGRNRRTDFVIFVVLSALIVSGRVVVA